MASLPEFANSITSKFKIPSTGKDLKKEGANPVSDTVVANNNTSATRAINNPIVPAPPPAAMADYYRYGRKNGNNEYEQMPGFIDAFNENNSRDQLASIRIRGNIKGGKEERDLLPPYTKFILGGVQEGHTERSQIVETFGDFYVFFYGERPPIYTFTGTLINTKSANWVSDFMYFYNNFFRGTKCVELKARLIITYQGRQVEGFILNTGTSTQAENQNIAQVSFQVVVTNRISLGNSNDFGIMENNGAFTDISSLLDILGTKGMSDPAVSKAYTDIAAALDGKKPAAEAEPVKSSDQDSLQDTFKKALGVDKVLGKLKIPGL